MARLAIARGSRSTQQPMTTLLVKVPMLLALESRVSTMATHQQVVNRIGATTNSHPLSPLLHVMVRLDQQQLLDLPQLPLLPLLLRPLRHQ